VYEFRVFKIVEEDLCETIGEINGCTCRVYGLERLYRRNAAVPIYMACSCNTDMHNTVEFRL
jgi:hypothetical protein